MADRIEPESTLITRAVDLTRSSALRVMVMGEGGVVIHPLPPLGEVTIGRSEECTIKVSDLSLSRRHCVLRISTRVEIVDLGSLNGTKVGDQKLEPGQAVELKPGDMVVIGQSALVLQSSATNGRPRRLWSHGYFEARLEEECARAHESGRTFGVMRLRLLDAARASDLEQGLSDWLRPVDIVATYAPNEYEVLLVDTEVDKAEAMARAIHAQLGAEGSRADLSLVCYPRDGRSPEALVDRLSSGGQSSHVDVAAAAATEEPMFRDGALKALRAMTERVAAGTINVMVLGETGVGKEVLSGAIHRLSPRAKKPFLAINCAALSETLLESELFGHERGAFTGAVQSKPGLLESAEGGTVFLDEVGEMPLTLQAKLLRVLEQREVMRVGSLKPRSIDVRFIAATNRDLEAEIVRGRFRQDLYFRLNGISIDIPPLRERRGEIESLARAFVANAARQSGRPPPRISAEAMALMMTYGWPGNIRELKNVMERAVILCVGDTILEEQLPREKMGPILPAPARTAPSRPPRPLAMGGGVSAGMPTMVPPRPTMPTMPEDASADPWADDSTENTQIEIPPIPQEAREAERLRIVRALEQCAGNQTQAAKLLGISRRTLVTRIEEFALPRPRKR